MAKATNTQRIYLVLDKTNNVGRLIEARSNVGALNHVTASRFETRIATQADLVYALTAGVPVEKTELITSAAEAIVAAVELETAAGNVPKEYPV